MLAGGPVQSRASKLSSATVSSPGSFQSHLPRPSAVGRSGSSGSSTGAEEKRDNGAGAGARGGSEVNKSFNSSLSSLSIESLDNTNADEEDLLADCISSAMPKSKSEHFDLTGKSKKQKKSPSRENSKSSEKEFRRSNSKSPKTSKLKPGVVIPDLKLKPLPSGPPAAGIDKADSEKSGGRVAPLPTRMAERGQEAASSGVWGGGGAMEATLTQSRLAGELELGSLVPGQEVLQEAHLLAQTSYTALASHSGDYSEMESLVADIGPPSIMMDSLPSLTQPAPAPAPAAAPPPRKGSGGEGAAAAKLPCRHTISAKLGSSVPVAVRRALGGSGLGSLSSEDLSSISSCHSNIDNIAPPSLLEDLDMENSMISVASISSEVAAALAASGASDDVSATSLTSEIIRDIVKPAARAVETFDLPSLAGPQLEAADTGSVSQQLESVAAPTLVEDTATLTLQPAPGAATYTVDDGADTIADVTDAFDDESVVEQTLMAGRDAEDFGDIPELPRDSRGATPAQSGGESSVENTPLPQRRLSPKERRQVDRDRYRTYTKSNSSSPSKKNDNTTSGQTFRQARLSDDDRFRTRTITKEDLSSPNSSPDKMSPRSIKQRRSEEAARYLTHTITPADLKPELESLSTQEAAMLESEARLVVKTITARKAEAKSRSASADPRSRSASTEILREHEMTRLDADSCVSSQENLLDGDPAERAVPGKPRICKPWESRVQQQDDSPQKSVRGRRRALYSPPMKRATVPPQLAPKPAARPRTASSPSTSPSGRPRGTRATQLRQASSSTLRSGSTGGSTSPRSLNSSGSSVASPRSLTSPHLRGVSSSPRHQQQQQTRQMSPDVRHQSPGASERPALVRQGTFTKDDDTNSNSSQSTTKTCLPKPTSQKKTPPKIAPKPSSLFNRKDAVQPSPGSRPALTMAGTTKTQQLREASFTRGAAVRSSASSTSSAASKTSVISRGSMRTSSSSHSLRNAAAAEMAPRRIPSSSDIERRKTSGSAAAASSPQNRMNVAKPVSAVEPSLKSSTITNTSTVTGKKNVTSKIASLWKKVEESKQKADAERNSKKYKPKEKKVWLGKGRVQTTDNAPASAGSSLVRSGTYDKINELVDTAGPGPAAAQTELKPRSRSRLSIKLGKFSLKKKSSLEERDTDLVNGNAGQQQLSPASPSDELGNSIQILSGSESDTVTTPPAALSNTTPDTVDMRSHAPQLQQPNHTSSGTGGGFRKSPASAIVAPFNYNPPSAAASAVQLKRNTSYVSSLGRRREEPPSGGGGAEDGDQEAECEQQKLMNGSLTNSAMVTLV